MRAVRVVARPVIAATSVRAMSASMAPRRASRPAAAVPRSMMRSMPGRRGISSIPYHPGLVLGNIVDPTLLAFVETKAKIYAPVDAKHDGVTELFNARRSLDLSLQELSAMKIAPTDEMLKTKADLDKEIGKSVTDLAKMRFKAVEESMKLTPPALVRDAIESPVNFSATEIKNLPLSADSLKLDSQYFRYESNKESKADYVNKVKAYVAGQVEALGSSVSAASSSSSEKQMSRQMNANNLEGTLIISAVCTHQQARLLSPMTLEVEKLINAWNEYNPKDRIEMPKDAPKIEAEGAKPDASKLKLLSGVTLGSSFIGMVHLLKSDKSQSSQDMAAAAARAEMQFKQSLFFASRSGKIGIDSSSAAAIKQLFSSSEIQCHITLQVMGVVPTIQASEGLKTVLRTMGDADGMADLLKLQNANAGEGGGMASMDSAGKSAVTNTQIAEMASKNTESAITAITKEEKLSDKMLDIGTLMTAFTNYVEKVSAGDSGVPINYFTKTITKYMIARLWKDKYFPNDFITTPYDAESGAKKA